MKIETFTRKSDTGAWFDLYVSIHCDECPSLHTYRGNKSEAPMQLRTNGWTLGQTGIVRCRPCSLKHTIAVHRAIA